MGLFSGKRRETITGIQQRMTSDDDFKYSSQIAVAHWIWDSKSKRDLSEYLIEGSQSSLPRRFDKLYRYAKKEGKYHYGLPTSHLSQEPENQILDATTNHLKNYHGGEIQVFHFAIGDKDFYMEAWHKLVTQLGYDTKTNELTVLSQEVGYPCYLYDGYLVLTENTQKEYSEIGFRNKGLPFNYGKYFEREESIITIQTPHITGNTDHMIITYGYDDTSGVKQATKEIDLSMVNPELQEGDVIPLENDWVYMTYIYDDGYYWFRYEYGSGDIVEIDNALTASEGFGEYYPRLYVRLNQSNLYSWHKDNKARKDTIKMFKKLDLDLKEITDGLYNSIGSEYWDTRGIYLFMGVQVNASIKEPAIAEYCFNYFKRLFDISKKVDVYKTIQETDNTGRVVNKQVLDDTIQRCMGGVQTIQDKASTQTLHYGFIDITEHTGVITDVGKFSSKPRENNYHIFIHQKSEDTYIKVAVQGLHQRTYLSGYGFVKWADDADLVIPIDRSIIHHLTGRERELLFHKSFHVCILHVKVTKTKWYQRGAFKVLLAVIAVAITIATKGAGTPLAQMIKSAAISALKAVAVSYAVNALVKVAVKLGLSPKLAGVVAFVASLALTAGVSGFDFSKVLTAPNIMKALNQFFKFYEKMLQNQYLDTINQMRRLQDTVKDRNELLKEKQKLLNTKVFNPSQELLRSNYTPTVNLFETPDMFYDRHYNYDVVAVSYGLITDFVSGSLANKQLYYPPQEDIEDVLIIE